MRLQEGSVCTGSSDLQPFPGSSHPPFPQLPQSRRGCLPTVSSGRESLQPLPLASHHQDHHHHNSRTATDHLPEFYIHGTPAKVVQHFFYLGSILNPTCLIDNEIQACINLASSAFGRLRSRVFVNKDLRTFTKAAVYQAVCVSTLLFAAEAWTPYHRHIRCHIRCLQRILGVTWKDKIPHMDILQRTNSSSMEATLARRQLRWVGHVIRMPSHRLPQQVLYGQIYSANRRPGGQKRRYKDHLKGTLKSCGINLGVLETTATNRQPWSSACNLEVQQIDLQSTQHRTVLHQRSHQRAQPQPHPSPDSAFTCPECGRS